MKVFISATTCVFLSLVAFSQDTIYYDFDGEPVGSVELANIYKVVSLSDTNRANVKTYLKSGEIIKEINYSDYDSNIYDGPTILYYKTSQIHLKMNYSSGKLDGEVISYWPNGGLKRKEFYNTDSLVQGSCFDHVGKDTVYYPLFQMAEYSGGINEMYSFIIKETKYPKYARKKGIQGKIIVEFIVNKDGSISNIKVVKSLCPELDDEAIRVVSKMPNWNPGKQDGQCVRTMFKLPFNFKLED